MEDGNGRGRDEEGKGLRRKQRRKGRDDEVTESKRGREWKRNGRKAKEVHCVCALCVCIVCVHCVWCIVCGAMCVGHCVWCFVCVHCVCALCMVHCAWCIVCVHCMCAWCESKRGREGTRKGRKAKEEWKGRGRDGKRRRGEERRVALRTN